MPELNLREQSLVNSLQDRLKDADALQVDAALKELEASDEYQNPSNPDHHAYLNMVPIALARRMTLAGDNPHAIGNDADSSMADNQRYTHELYEEEKPLTFEGEDKAFETRRANIQQHLEDLKLGKIKGVDEENLPHFIEGTQKQIIQMDVEQGAAVKARDTELARMDDQQTVWDKERVERAAQMKKDFMAMRMKDVLPDDQEARQAQADQEWQRLSADYGF